MLAGQPVTTRALVVLGLVAVVCLAGQSEAFAQHEPPSEPPADWGPTAIDYSNVPYPHPVSYLDISLKGEDYRMAYMDVPPGGPPNGQTVVLFHGMNFFAAAFGVTIEALSSEGFRVVAVDRIGYGRSSKPVIHYNLHMPARHTKQLLDTLGIDRAAVLGHSMGGMVATRFASTYPDVTSHVVFVNQIGLTDTRAGREWMDPEEAYQSALGTNPAPQGFRGHLIAREYSQETCRNGETRSGIGGGGGSPEGDRRRRRARPGVGPAQARDGAASAARRGPRVRVAGAGDHGGASLAVA